MLKRIFSKKLNNFIDIKYLKGYTENPLLLTKLLVLVYLTIIRLYHKC